MTSRVLVADDHPLAREALQFAIRSNWPGNQVDEAANLAQVDAALSRRKDYRLVVLDLMLPDARGFSGLLLIQKLAEGVPVVIVSAKEDAQTVATAHLLGAAGFVSKSTAMSEIAAVLKRVVEGERVFPANAAAPTPGAADMSRRLASLSGAQLKVMIGLADGRLNKQIAGDMNITEATVKAHLTAIFRKLGVGNRTQAVLAARPLLVSGGEASGGD
jgi:DNA-binding NarL/FixJ family response regulator